MALMTDENIKAICKLNGWDDSYQSLRFARAIEAEARQRMADECAEICDELVPDYADCRDSMIVCANAIREHAAKEKAQ